jgi:N-methylhydantoinase A/oxoprolinase/acetone carboxylase beta subunit
MGFSYYNPLLIARLEESHLVQRCGFTPTDVLNCRGDLTLWSTGTSMKMLDVLSAAIGKKPDELIEELMQEVIKRFALAVFQRQLDEEIDTEELENCRICRVLTDRMLSDGNPNFEIRLKMQRPIIGIGAPVHLILPAAASLLGAEYVLPEHADVANAIGAITSKVIVRRRVEIRARQNGGFRIEGLPGVEYFSDFKNAYAWAKKELVRIVQETARISGTKETAVKINLEDHTRTMVNSKPINLGCGLLAELKGNPSYE